jgi:L-aspartate oxidase
MEPLMRLPITNGESFDVVILGAGLAAMTVALSLPSNMRIAIVAQSDSVTSSHWAKGGVAAAFQPPDDVGQHLADTLQAGGGLSDPIAADLMVHNAPEAIDFLRSQGTIFETIPEREAGHSQPRIWHADGDATGAAIMNALGAKAQMLPNLTSMPGNLIAILTNDSWVSGVLISQEGSTMLLRSSKLVVATGGATGLWSDHTSPATNLGLGVVAAYSAGAVVGDLEFTQFHPTAIALSASPLMLATEALRGAGAWIIDSDGKRFLFDYDPAGELATRDKVSLAMYRHQTQAYLDARPIDDHELAIRFPTFVTACQENGLDPNSTPIPIRPAAHYSMGGIVTGSYGETSMAGLYAVGECANSGVHGANRLASNSLLEGLIFGRRAALHLSSMSTRSGRAVYPSTCDLPTRAPRLDVLMNSVDTALGIERSSSTIRAAHETLVAGGGAEEMDPFVGHRNVAASLLVSLMLEAAENRTGSVGSHTRSDELAEDPRYRLEFQNGSKIQRVRRNT